MQNVVGEIQVISCECSSYVIFLLVSALGKFLELRHDQVITSLAITERTHPVINFLPSIQA